MRGLLLLPEEGPPGHGVNIRPVTSLSHILVPSVEPEIIIIEVSNVSVIDTDRFDIIHWYKTKRETRETFWGETRLRGPKGRIIFLAFCTFNMRALI